MLSSSMSCNTRYMCGRCDKCYERCFEKHPFSIFWSEQNTTSPRLVFAQSIKKYWFDCNICKHSFDTSPANISKGKGCPYCSKPCKKLCATEDCEWCFKNSFASSTHAAEWGENALQPRQVFLCSNQKANFLCKDCNHTFSMMPNDVTQGVWCPYCSWPTKAMCDKVDCVHCFSRSFASCVRAANWCPLNEKKPRDYFLFSHNKVSFVCDACDTRFSAALSDVASGKFCSVCRNKTEKLLLQWLRKEFDELKIRHQATYDWCIVAESKQKCRFDFAFESLQLILECDGIQHYYQSSPRWKSPELQRISDDFKANSAMAQGYTVVRILQEDVFFDRGGWQAKLRSAIHQHDYPTTYTLKTGRPLPRKVALPPQVVIEEVVEDRA